MSDTVSNEEVKDEVKVDEKVEEKAEETFTKDQVTEMIKKEIARKSKNFPSKEELDAYNSWKESQKTTEEKNAEKEKELADALKKITMLENEKAVLSANVEPKFAKFIISEVSEINGDFSENLSEYLKENPQFIKKEEVREISTGQAIGSVAKTKSDAEMYLDKKYANNPYYKKR